MPDGELSVKTEKRINWMDELLWDILYQSKKAQSNNYTKITFKIYDPPLFADARDITLALNIVVLW